MSSTCTETPMETCRGDREAAAQPNKPLSWFLLKPQSMFTVMALIMGAPGTRPCWAAEPLPFFAAILVCYYWLGIELTASTLKPSSISTSSLRATGWWITRRWFAGSCCLSSANSVSAWSFSFFLSSHHSNDLLSNSTFFFETSGCARACATCTCLKNNYI